MPYARPLTLLLTTLIVGCVALPSGDAAGEAYRQLRAQSELAAYTATYDTTVGRAVVYASPPLRRLDVEGTVAGEAVTVARYYRSEGTYICDITHRPRRCTVTDEPDGTPHAQSGDPSVTRIERAPARTIAGLAATCFALTALVDERWRREVCFSAEGVLLLIVGPIEAGGPIVRIEATRVTSVERDQLNPYQ